MSCVAVIVFRVGGGGIGREAGGGRIIGTLSLVFRINCWSCSDVMGVLWSVFL